MWLFDNLFLDQNTPVTINDGVDHSKDVVTHMVDPTDEAPAMGAKSGSSGWNPQDDKKKDDSISDLFDSDKKEEKQADATLNPEPPADIALEIGKAPEPDGAIAPLDPDGGIASFDIGGDVSFDTLPESSLVVEEPTMTQTDPALDPSIMPVLNLTGSVPEVTPELSGSFLGTPQDGAAVPPEAPQATEEKKEEVSAETPKTDETPKADEAPVDAGLGASGGIFWLIGWGDTPSPAPEAPKAEETPAPEVTPTPLGASGILWTPESAVLWAPPSPATPAHDTLAAPDTAGSTSSMESLLGRDALALFTQWGQTSTLLREKLNTFIEELKVLHSRDQSQRYHKLEQIAMYEERIREIDAEAATRKRVLQAEIDDLKRQIEMMDREKDDIQDVISTFRKEIGNS